MAEFRRYDGSLESRTPEGLDHIRTLLQAVIHDKKQYNRVLEAREDEAQQLLDALQVASTCNRPTLYRKAYEGHYIR